MTIRNFPTTGSFNFNIFGPATVSSPVTPDSENFGKTIVYDFPGIHIFFLMEDVKSHLFSPDFYIQLREKNVYYLHFFVPNFCQLHTPPFSKKTIKNLVAFRQKSA